MPSTSLVWPSNCGSGSRTPITAVSPSSDVFLVAGSSPFFSSRAARSCSFSVLTSARSKPVTCVPPLGVAITLTNDTGHGVVPGAPPQRDVDLQLPLHVRRRHVPLVVEHRHGLGELAGAGQPQHVGQRLTRRQVLAELADSPVEAELGFFFRTGGWSGLRPPPSRPPPAELGSGPPAPARAVVADPDRQAGNEVGGLPGALHQRLEAPLRVLGEHLPVRPEPDPGAGHLPGHLAGLAQALAPGEGRPRALGGELAGHAAAEGGGPFMPLPVDLDVQPGRQRVHHRGADTVQATGGGVGAAAELAPGVQPGHDQLDAGQPGLGLHVHRDAPPVVPDLSRHIRM